MADLLTPVYLVAIAAALAVTLRSPDARRLACTGALVAALGAGTLALAPGDGPVTTLLARATRAGLPRYVLGINVGLTVIGLVLLVGAATLRGVSTAPAAPAADTAAYRDLGRGLGEFAATALAWSLSFWAGVVVLGWFAWHLGPARRWLLPLGVLPLVMLGWYAATVGGAWRLPLDAWSAVPISTAGARVAAGPLAVAALAWSGAAFSQDGRRMAWVGPLLFGWPGLALAAPGLEELRPVLLPMAVGLTALAAWRGAGWAAIGVAVAVAAVTQPETTVLALALPALLALAVAAQAIPWAGRGSAALLAAAGVLAVPAVLRGEFVWALALIGALLAVLWRRETALPPVELIP